MFLVVTGGEALYADMGHFGRRPIAVAWFVLVLPALLLNYFGQGALLLAEPDAIESPLFRMAPEWALYPLVVLATMADRHRLAGADLGRLLAHHAGHPVGLRPPAPDQAHVRLGVRAGVPAGHQLGADGRLHRHRDRLRVVERPGRGLRRGGHVDHGDHHDPLLRRAARAAGLVDRGRALSLCGAFMVLDVAFFGANLFKIPTGGWFPIIVAGVMFTLMTTWHTGRRLVAARIRRERRHAGRLPRHPARAGHTSPSVSRAPRSTCSRRPVWPRRR